MIPLVFTVAGIFVLPLGQLVVPTDLWNSSHQHAFITSSVESMKTADLDLHMFSKRYRVYITLCPF